MECEEKHTPLGVINEDSAFLRLPFASSTKTSDLLVDSLGAWWERPASEARARATHLQCQADDGAESHARRRQFLKRLVEFADHIDKFIRLLDHLPCYSKWNPVDLSGPGA